MKRTDLGLLALTFSLGSLLVACSGGADRPTEVTPPQGSARGGELVTITGSGFGKSPVVKFGARVATVRSASDTSIEVTAPPGIAGAVDVEVTAGSEQAVLAKAFTYQTLPLALIDVAWSLLPPLPVNGGSAAIADGDGNGHPDVFQAARGEGVWVYPNGGKGQFGQPLQVAIPGAAAPADVWSVVTGDFDGDGKIDLFLGATGGTASQVLLGDGAFGFVASATALPALFGTQQRAVAVDLDGDGSLDLVTVGSAATAMGTTGVVILHNDGHGTFTDVTADRLPDLPFDASGVAVGDVDGDGDLDLFFAADQEACRLYLNDGHGAFQRAAPDAIPYNPMPGAGIPALGDLDGDGSLDIYLPTTTQDQVWFNDGKGHFTDLTDVRLGPDASAGASATLVDLDLDGHLDVAALDGTGRVRIYRNDGTGRLFDYSGEIAGNDGQLPAIDVAVGDLDEDGVPDLFVSRQDLARAALLVDWSPLSVPDTDQDGVPDTVDNCPAVPNPDQASLYGLPFRCASATGCAAATGCELHVLAGSAYLFCKAAATWAAASDACTALGATLVTVTGADDNAFLTTLGAAGAWIGYTDTATPGTFAWTSGSSSTYTNWSMGQPDSGGGKDDCAVLGADGTWSDAPCSGTHPYLCQDQRSKKPGPGEACDCSMGGAMGDGGASACGDGGADGGGDGSADGGT